MKLSLKQANDLLKKLGVNAAIVESEDKADKDADITALATEATEGIKESVKGDIIDEYKETEQPEAMKGEIGKLLGTMRSQFVKAFGGWNKEYEKGEDGKALDIAGMVTLAKTKYDSRAGKAQQDWETEREQLLQDHETALEALRTEKDTEVTNWQKKYEDRDINEHLIKHTEKIPRSKGEVTEHAEYGRYKLEKQGYTLKYNAEAKKLELLKDGKVVKENGKAVEVEDKLKQIYTENGWVVTDTKHVNPATVKDGTNTQVKSGIENIPVNSNVPDNFAGLMAELNEG